MRMPTIQHCTQMRRRHFLALFNAGYFHKNNCIILAQFSTKMPWIRPMQIWRFDRIAVTELNGQQFRCFYQQNNEELIAEFHNATKVAAFPLELESQEKFEQKTVDGHQILAQRSFPSAQHSGQPDFLVKYELGTSGRKIIQIHKRDLNEFMDFKKIRVPEDIFFFMQAMDEVLNAVHTKRNEIERATDDKRLHIVKAKGRNYDYQMKLAIYNGIVDVQLQSMGNAARLEHKGKLMILPLPAFHWLRHAIGELFAANGEEHIQLQLGKPPALPAWLRLDSPMRVLSPNNSRIALQQPHEIMATQPQNVPMKNAEAINRPRRETLERRIVPLDRHGQQQLIFYCKIGQSGQKFFHIVKVFAINQFYNLPKIHAPEDVLAFVQAMDRLLNFVHANRDIMNTHKNQMRASHLVLQTVKATGTNYDFELVLYINKYGQVEVELRSVPNQSTPEHKPRRIYLPHRHFHWLRHAIGEVFAKEFGMLLGRTPHYPEWLNSDCFPHALSPENNQKLSQQQQHQNKINIFEPPQQQWQPQQRRVDPFAAQPQQYAQLMRESQLPEQLAPAPGRTTMEMERLHQLVQQQQKQLKQMQTAMDRMVAEQRREVENNEQMTELINLLHRKMSNKSAEQSNRNSNDE